MPEAYIVAVANRLGAAGLRLSDRIRTETERATGMSGGIPAALVSLREWADGSAIEVLADAMQLSHSRAVRVVDRLETAGLARRAADPADGRRSLVWLEPEGRALADRALAARARVLHAAIATLDGEQMCALDQLLSTILSTTTVDTSSARSTCRLCDASGCGHYEGSCPVTAAAERAKQGAA